MMQGGRKMIIGRGAPWGGGGGGGDLTPYLASVCAHGITHENYNYINHAVSKSSQV